MTNEIQKYCDNFINAAKGVNEEDKVLGLLNEIEEKIYSKVSKDVNEKLIKELQKNANLAQVTQQPEFLRVTPNVDSQYMHSHINFSKIIQQNQPIDRQNFQQSQNQEIINFPIYQQNFLDTNANAKHYYPQTQPKGLYDIPKQFVDQTNVQNFLIQQTPVYNFSQPETKQVFPRNLIEKAIPTYPDPDYITKQESQFNFSSQVNKMGGLINALGPMQSSLKQNEQRLFLNTPEHTLLQGATEEKSIYVPPPFVPVPAPPPPDPFLTNPQYRLYGVQQQQPQLNLQSYLPENSFCQTQQNKLDSTEKQIESKIVEENKQGVSQRNQQKSNINNSRLRFLDEAKIQRQRKEQHLQF